jgi:transcriptional adapter 2-alpha
MKSTSLIEVTSAPGAELLSEKEKELCALLQLLPRPYMAIKEALLKESAKLGYLEKGRARQLMSVDVDKKGQVYDFFVNCG